MPLDQTPAPRALRPTLVWATLGNSGQRSYMDVVHRLADAWCLDALSGWRCAGAFYPASDPRLAHTWLNVVSAMRMHSALTVCHSCQGGGKVSVFREFRGAQVVGHGVCQLRLPLLECRLAVWLRVVAIEWQQCISGGLVAKKGGHRGEIQIVAGGDCPTELYASVGVALIRTSRPLTAHPVPLGAFLGGRQSRMPSRRGLVHAEVRQSGRSPTKARRRRGNRRAKGAPLVSRRGAAPRRPVRPCARHPPALRRR